MQYSCKMASRPLVHAMYRLPYVTDAMELLRMPSRGWKTREGRPRQGGSAPRAPAAGSKPQRKGVVPAEVGDGMQP